MDYTTTEYDYEISKAILKGAMNSIKGTINMVLHPLDNLVYPISDLIYDATIISTKYVSNHDIMGLNGDMLMLKHIVNRNPQLYSDSQTKMNNRISAVQDKLLDTTVFEKIELLSEFTTTIFVPGCFLKDIKYLSGVNDVMTAASFIPTIVKGEIQSLTKEEIGSLTGFHQLLYMEVNEQPIITHYNNCNLVDAMILHPELATLIKVNNAEIVYVNDGKIITDTKLNENFPTISNNDVVVAAKNATQAFKQLSTMKEENIKEQLLSIAKPLHHFGVIGSDIATVALMVGGHKRTWNNIAKVSQCSLKIATSLTTLAASSATGCITGCLTGGIGCITGIIGAFSAIFGDDDGDDGLQQIGAAIMAVHHAVIALHQDMIQCFQRLEELLLVSVIAKLNQINANIYRLEEITTQSFKELHTKHLIDIIDTLNKEITGEFPLTTAEKRLYLRQLSCWIDNHSKSTLQTQILRKNADKPLLCSILKDDDIMSYFSLFLVELKQLCPMVNVNYNVANLEVLTIACEVYMIVTRRLNMKNKEVIVRALKNINDIHIILEELQKPIINDETILDILQRQYNYYRYSVGQVIAKIRNGATWSQGTLNDVLKEDANKALLVDLLDDMELRRLFIFRLQNLLSQDTNNLESKDNIFVAKEVSKDISLVLNSLESKDDILLRAASSYNQNGNIYTYFNNGDIEKIKNALFMGTDPNVWNSWGKPIHYVTKNNGSAVALHMLFKMHPSLTADISGGTRTNQGDTWGVGATPIVHAMNMGHFPMGTLFCANGLTISEVDARHLSGLSMYNYHMGNAYWWRDNGSVNSIINTRLVRQYNTSDSVISKEKLQAAYKYYILVEAGFLQHHLNVQLDALLLLTCILGDLLPLTLHLSKTLDTLDDILSKPILGVGVGYNTLAKTAGHTNVVDFLESFHVTCVDEGKLNTCTIAHSSNNVIQQKITYHKKNNNITQPISDKIKLYLEDNVIVEEPTILNECQMYVDMLMDMVSLVPTDHKLYDTLTKRLTHCVDAISTKNYTTIAKTFNSIDAILSMTLDNYKLSPHILNLIADLKLLS